MNKRFELISKLNTMLFAEMPQYEQMANSFGTDAISQRQLLRSLMNVRAPTPLNPELLALQDELLKAEKEEKGVVDAMALPTTADPRIVLWQGDITRLNADAIVNAANSALLGCFSPCHGCIDNAIHSAAGLQLRDECSQLIIAQGHEESTGLAKITRAYNLPSKYVLHTVGPIVQGPLTKHDCDQLASCYRSCLDLTAKLELQSVAFCCISTGEFHFPNDQAAKIAVQTVKEFLRMNKTIKKIIFDVFKAQDLLLYRNRLYEQ